METPGYTPQPQAAEPKSNRTMIIVVVVLIILCCCCLIGTGLGYWLWNNGDQLMGTGALLPALTAL
jgi:hypothetical protein